MITRDEVTKVARLSKLRLDDARTEEMTKELSRIMQMIDQLQAVDVEGVVPLTSVSGQGLRMRQDQVTDGNIDNELFNNAPGKTGDLARDIKCFVVPKVVE